jgi:hypothetical protein
LLVEFSPVPVRGSFRYVRLLRQMHPVLDCPMGLKHVVYICNKGESEQQRKLRVDGKGALNSQNVL